jgi:hypothetical protein
MTITSTFIHQADIQNALDIYAEVVPYQTARASEALHILLQDHYQEDSGIAWQSSTLTGDGFPLEFAFTPIDADLRYTTEISSPLIPAEQRLSLACQRLQNLTSNEVPLDLVTQLQQIQQGNTLCYGTWVGGRHGRIEDRFKLYVEVPESKAEDYQSLLQNWGTVYPRLTDRPVYLRMLGYNLSSQLREIYFRSPNIENYHLRKFLALYGLTERADELWHFLEESYEHRLFSKLPGRSIGISYAITPNGALVSFTLFLFANIFWGSDAVINRKFTALAEKYHWDIGIYRQLTKEIATRQTKQTYHGILGFVVTPTLPIAINLGVRPWRIKAG